MHCANQAAVHLCHFLNDMQPTVASTYRPKKWLIVSTSEVTLADVCVLDSADQAPEVTSIVYQTSGSPAPLRAGTLMATDQAHLRQLVLASDADFTLCVVPARPADQVGSGILAESALQEVNHTKSLELTSNAGACC